MATIYSNNDVLIETKSVDSYEMKVNINGSNLMWISREDEGNFKRELREVLDRYRI